jgi:xanthine/CO dehydrogenase XdhC/CoxF family maturation factor
MGVDIAALTPAEIALSVVARLVERRRRPGLRAG